MATKPKPLLRADEAGASDKIEATLILGKGHDDPGPGPELNPDVLTRGHAQGLGSDPEPQWPSLHTQAHAPGQGQQGTALRDIHTPEHAVAVLKEKVGLLHTSLNNVGHFSSVAFNDAEQLAADIRWLLSYLRSKV